MTITLKGTDIDQAAFEGQEVALVDLLDRLLASGVVITGEVTISIAGVDLVYVSLNALLTSIRRGGPGPFAPGYSGDET